MSAAVGLGLIGCGWAAGEIVRAAANVDGLKVVSTFDVDATRAADYAARAGATASASVEAVLANPAVTAVYVGLPHHLLAGTVQEGLRASKHVLAEKPLALDAAEALRLGRIADEKGLKLAVFYELRCAGTVEVARRLIAEGAIGEPRLVRIRTLIAKRLSYWGEPGALNWRAHKREAGGGVVLMNTVHQLDTLRYITGLEFIKASGTIATFAAPADVEDAASATLILSNGGIVSLVASAHSPGADEAETIEIDGTAGGLDLPDPFGTAPIRIYRNADAAWQEIPVDRPDSHRLMLEGFVDAVRNDSPVPASALDAAAALAVVQAIYRSHAEGRAIDMAAIA